VVKGASKIETGSKVAVVGGGPAGSFFALYLLRYAEQRDIHPEITIYQQRDFNELGPKGCKGCAGILSISLLKNLTELNLSIPAEIIQNEIEHYAVHSPYTSISISNPEKGIKIASIYRGGGSIVSHSKNPVSFDGWLLKQAQGQGVEVENHTVSGIDLGDETIVRVGDKKLRYDLVVLACGVNSGSVPIVGLDYVPPQTRRMAMAELHADAAQVESRLGSVAHVVLIPHSGLIFGTLVPKGPLINVSVLSKRKHPVSVNDFLSHRIVQNMLPDNYRRVCGCRPRAAIVAAHNYFANRFVAIGDAAVSRLYKDGIGSALLTAREASRTIIEHGITRHDFQRAYQPLCSRIDRDNRWGELLFSINDRVKNSRAFLLAQHRLIGDEQDNVRGPQPFTKAAWGMFSGTYSYRNIARMVASPASLGKLSLVLFRESFGGLYAKRTAYPKKLHVGSRKVLILGSGFGGTYVLRHLVPSLNRNENVETTMVSDENFFLFSPLLHQVAMGGIETRHIAYPIRRLHWRDRFNFVQARVEKIDLQDRKVVTTMGVLDFDCLVLALGSVTDTSELNGQGGNVFTLKTLRDSMLIRNHIIGIFERASAEPDPKRQGQLLTFVISGAGYIGVQLVAELRDFVFRNLIRFYRSIDPGMIRIILVEAEPRIVADLHASLGAYAMKHLQRMGVEIRLRSRVTRVWEDHVEIDGTELVPASTLIWQAGAVANPRIANLDAKKDSLGRLLVNEYLEVPGIPGVYAVGDCAHFSDPRSGEPIPPRATIAVRQAKIVAHNILAEIRGKEEKPFHYSGTPEILSLGASKAVLLFHGLRLYGFLARLIWLVVYSSLVTGTYNRVRVLSDWLLSLLFGRDITFLKLTQK
jgi:NADH dehydrogenase